MKIWGSRIITLSLASTPQPDPKLEPDPSFTIEANRFRPYQIYTRNPQTDLEENLTLENLLDDTISKEHLNHSKAMSTEIPHSDTIVNFFHPFPNKIVFQYMY
jgi:hypothetical protein